MAISERSTAHLTGSANRRLASAFESVTRWALRGRLGSSRNTDLGRYTGGRV